MRLGWGGVAEGGGALGWRLKQGEVWVEGLFEGIRMGTMGLYIRYGVCLSTLLERRVRSQEHADGGNQRVIRDKLVIEMCASARLPEYLIRIAVLMEEHGYLTMSHPVKVIA